MSLKIKEYNMSGGSRSGLKSINGLNVPESGVFNPYDYISQSDYKLNRRGKAQYQEDLAQLQYLAELRQQEYARSYESEQAQAERMRSAGMNPDLLGVDSGTMGASPQTGANPLEGLQTNGERASQVVGDITSIISTTASLATGAMGIASGLEGLEGSKLQNLSSALNVADSAYSLFSKWSAGDPQGMDGFINAIPTLSSRKKNKLQKMYDQWSSSPYMDKASTKFETEMMETTGEFYKKAVDPKYNSESVAGYVEAWTPLVDALNKMAESEAKGRKAKGDYDAGYYTPEGATSDRSRKSAENEMFGQIRGPLIEVLDNFKKMQEDAPKGSREYETALYSRAFLSGMILKFFSGM